MSLANGRSTRKVLRFISNKDFKLRPMPRLLKGGKDNQNPPMRIRTKMQRWKLSLPPRITADRVELLLRRLSSLVAHRVHAAIWKTCWNGWCTKRGFQQEGACLFRCGDTSRDCIEHYAFCPLYKHCRHSALKLPPVSSLDVFFMLDHKSWTDDRFIVESIGVFALYSCFNAARVGGLLDCLQKCMDAIDRLCYHAVLNHSRSSKAFRRCT